MGKIETNAGGKTIVFDSENKILELVRVQKMLEQTTPGPQGERGPELRIQYSIDGVTGWTYEQPTSEFMYFRVSTDEGLTWSEPILFGTEQAAYEHAQKAEQWAENPENVEVETGQYSALHHKEKAIDAQVAAETAQAGAEAAELSASNYASDASTSASNATVSETNALASENKAHKWAEEDENVEVEPGEYSAYHWAKKAEAAAPPSIEDQIIDGVTLKAPSQNAVYDALIDLERKVGRGILI
jgi:hypothetical protein